MKKFLAIFTGTEVGRKKFDALDEATRKDRTAKGMAAWQKWATDHANSIVGTGGPLGKTKRVDPQGISDIRNAMAAFNIVQAESHEAAAKIFLNHPHFTIFPGDGVEIMECLPIPEKP